MRRQKAHLVSLLFLCVAYINKSIYIYELAVEFCIFESSIIILKNLPDGFITLLCSGTSQFTD